MSLHLLSLCLLTLSALTGFALPASAATYYVKNGGDDSLSGLDQAHAWAHAPGMDGWTGSATIAAGDHVLFRRGDTWTFAAEPNGTSYTIPSSGTANAPIFYGAFGTGARPIFDGNGLQEWYGMVSLTSISYVTIDNWDLTGSQNQLMQVWGPNSTGVIVQNCAFHDNTQPGYMLVEVEGLSVGGVTNITFAGNEFYNGPHDGLKFNDGVTYGSVHDNTFHDIYHDGIDSLSLRSPGFPCSNFEIFANDISAITSDDTNEPAGMYIPGLRASMIHDNVIHDIPGDGIKSDAQAFSAQNLTIRNNVFYNLSGSGTYAVWFTSGNTGIDVWNNTLYNCNCPDIDDGGETFANNLAYGCASDQHTIKNLTDDPLFVDPTATPPDFHLQAGSPAIDAGVDVGLPYNGVAPDLGAFEFCNSASCSSTGGTTPSPSSPSPSTAPGDVPRGCNCNAAGDSPRSLSWMLVFGFGVGLATRDSRCRRRPNRPRNRVPQRS